MMTSSLRNFAGDHFEPWQIFITPEMFGDGAPLSTRVDLISDFRFSDPFLYSFSFNFGPNKGLLKKSLICHFQLRVK